MNEEEERKAEASADLCEDFIKALYNYIHTHKEDHTDEDFIYGISVAISHLYGYFLATVLPPDEVPANLNFIVKTALEIRKDYINKEDQNE